MGYISYGLKPWGIREDGLHFIWSQTMGDQRRWVTFNMVSTHEGSEKMGYISLVSNHGGSEMDYI